MTLTFFILTSDEMDEAAAFDNAEVALGARLIDADAPGEGLNLNPTASGYALGEAVPLAGKWVASQRIISDPDYIAHAPSMVAYLGDKPFAELDPETIFAPPDDM